MIQTALWPLQQAIYKRLANDIALNKKVTGVYDYVTKETPFPYMTIGEPNMSPFETKTSYSENIPWALHCYSMNPGKREVMEILNLMIKAMTKESWIVEGFQVIKFNIEPNMKVIPPADVGFPYQGVLNVRFYIGK
ncbi:DUF3168 domain-containing protein [Virgibacillus sp. Bac330]|uniref:DUF3168 domain-containing protein n=1 Tax=Virgibacillus sp. Bac330 TaxID=2419841 RepID=UPI000EF4AF89|nr:DUF3168 domain-containing protein [Virgibacillus sp. Bac330]